MKFKLLLSFSFLLTLQSTWACTGIELKTVNGTFINGRTVEFGEDLDLKGIVIPRNYHFHGTLPDGSAGLDYVSKYAAIGAGTFTENVIVDGINEQGVSVGVFYFPGYAGYTQVDDNNHTNALSPTEFPNWILTQFSSVEEVKNNLKNIVIVNTAPPGWGKVPPFHFVVYDKSGKSIVIEPIMGTLRVYDNPLGVITNSPTFDWHLTNLSNFVNLSPLNAPTKTIDGIHIEQLGQGSGLLGMPGDFTPPSRFIRAAIFSKTAIPAKTNEQAVQQAFHILNQFDIPVGSVRASENKNMIAEYTLATTVKDPENGSYYFRTFDDQTIRKASLKNYDLNAKEIKHYNMKGRTPVVEVK
ncbi:choloylglycine hydrolase (plasmid) [Legionella adelaidensis]|uniref:Choloylglycine hydrolase n=1 Tax=Legionella adelaidensis TaxID=45056 RepID=A0A0W0R5D0_9GAMM|nr:choloylglycine hydrolase family protein [Legionella adelaidensis]KTC66305.1 choloylglycine hydrolase [Legionella adelaidensis]VEH84901.1 choloylglycine hydrolase [Legionella adelaidensis]